MHAFEVPSSLTGTMARMNCWALTARDVENLATELLGATPTARVRLGRERAIILKKKFGAAADRLPQELVRLVEQTAKVRADGGAGADMRAAAFFHLRFENIHPLHDGNGRVGRMLLAAQCSQASGSPTAEILTALHELEHDYCVVFAVPAPALQFDLMVHLLARILAVPVSDTLDLPFALTSVFPERDTRPAANMRNAPQTGIGRSAFF
jgi:hypothetical protein